MKKDLTLSQLHAVSEQINSTLDLKSLLTNILSTAKTMLNCEGSSLLLMDDEKKELYFNVAISEKSEILEEIRVPLGVGIAGLVAEKGEAIIVNDAANDKRIYREVDKAAQFETRNLLCVPMKVKDKLVGVLEVVNIVSKKGFVDDDTELLNYIANQAAISINNREMLDHLEQLNTDLASRLREQTILYEISQNTSYTYKLNDYFQSVLKIINKEMQVDKSSIFIFDAKENKLKLRSHLGLNITDSKISLELHEGIIGEVFQSEDPLLVMDVEKDSRFKDIKKEYYSSNSFLSLPLLNEGKAIGVISVTDKLNNQTFDMHDLVTLTSVASHIASAVNSIDLKRQILDQEKIKRELEAAASIQNSILPKEFNTSGIIEISAITYPAENVGGDFYDFVRKDENKFGILIGDVSGKGIPAAIFMALVRNVIRAESKLNSSPSRLFTLANDSIYSDSQSGMFATAAYFLIDSHNHIVTYCNAGHNTQYLYRHKTNKIDPIQSKGIPLGVMPDLKFEEKVILYEPGDTLILYTDGIIEALNPDEEEYGDDRLLQFIEDNGKMDKSDDILNSLKGDIIDFMSGEPLFDDFSIMIVKL